MQTIDIQRCLKAMSNIYINGRPRNSMIEEAIALIQKDGATAMSTEYLGMKNYAGFGDQRHDGEYGYGPKHGHIVFSIGRTEPRSTTVLGEDEVYLLECARDFGTFEDEQDLNDYRKPTQKNLLTVIRQYIQNRDTADHLLQALQTAPVETTQV